MHRQVGRTVTIALLLAHAAVPAWAAGPIERLSVGPGGIEGDGPSAGPALSAQGRFVAFSRTPRTSCRAAIAADKCSSAIARRT